MLKRSRRVVAWLMAVMVLVSLPAQAGLSEALNSMFVGNVTNPGVYSSQTRGGFVGGSASFRAPVRSVNLFTFDPPRLDLGCGGVDFFGGSFSFINADQLVALFRQIASNAIGVAFKRAINAISPDLGTLMENFQNKLQALNQAMKNTCALANMVVNSVADPSAAANQAQEITGKVKAATGSATDLFSGILDFFSKPSKGMKDAAANNQCSICGNLVWKSLTDNNAEEYFGAADGNQTSAREVIMSLIGTVVVNAESDDQEPTSAPFDPTISMRVFRYGSKHDGPSNVGMQIWHCADGYGRNKCLSLEKRTTDFDGAEGYVRKMLFGAADAVVSQSGSIIDKVQNCSSGTGTSVCGFTAEQQSFIGMVPAPVLTFFKSLQHTPAAMESLAAAMVSPMADAVALHYGRAAIMAAGQAMSGSKGKKLESFPIRIAALQAEINDMEAANRDSMRRIMEANAYVAEVAKSNPAFFVRSTRRR